MRSPHKCWMAWLVPLGFVSMLKFPGFRLPEYVCFLGMLYWICWITECLERYPLSHEDRHVGLLGFLGSEASIERYVSPTIVCDKCHKRRKLLMCVNEYGKRRVAFCHSCIARGFKHTWHPYYSNPIENVRRI